MSHPSPPLLFSTMKRQLSANQAPVAECKHLRVKPPIREMSFLFFPFHNLKTSVQREVANTAHQVLDSQSRRIMPENIPRRGQSGSDSERYPGSPARGSIMLKLPHTRFGVLPPPLLPTYRQTVHDAQPVPHLRVGESASANTQGKAVTTKHTELAPDLLPSPSPTSNASERLSSSAKTPSVAPWKGPWTRLCFSHPIPANRGTGSQRKSASPSTAPGHPEFA